AMARDDYRMRLEAHLAAVRALCERLGITHLQLPTSKPLEVALFDFLQARASRGKLIQRKGAAA
ncbi:MAG: DUF58 domain-containing protein, partial [Verrucomicrobiota bacterium]